MMCGGYSDERQATEEDQTILNTVKEHVEHKLSKTFSTFQAITCKSQVVAGMNYEFKVKIDEGSHIVVKIHQPLPHTRSPPQLMSVE